MFYVRDEIGQADERSNEDKVVIEYFDNAVEIYLLFLFPSYFLQVTFPLNSSSSLYVARIAT